jgi:hypothetical protein
VSQNPFLFNDTVEANIKLARQDATISEIRNAARLAHADGFIDQLPLGLDTMIGERGARLSAGQAQRIALARAFLKDSPLVILDEATSHLDPETDAFLLTPICPLTVFHPIVFSAKSTVSVELLKPKKAFVFVDGHFAPELSCRLPGDEGVILGSLAASIQSHPALLQSWLGRVARHEQRAFTALNTAFIQDGAFLRVPDRATVANMEFAGGEWRRCINNK